MLRNLIVLLLLVFASFFVGLQLAYKTMDPCHALRVEQARRSAAPTGLARIFARVDTAGMDRWQCSRGLLDSWQDRLSQ